MLNAAVIGLGNIGREHALAILENASCNLSYLYDLDIKKIRDFINKNNATETISANFDTIINDEKVDIISIATFDDDHYDKIMTALNMNKHIFVEKPLCQNSSQLLNIVKEFSQQNCGIVSNLVLRTSALFQYIQKLINAGELGEIYCFEGDYLYGRLHKITDGWRKDVKDYSVMEGGGIHIVDLMIGLTKQKPKRVYSLKNKIVTKNSPTFKYHDFQTAFFSFESGLIGKITANFGCVHPHQHIVKIYGTKGTFIYDDQGARIYWERDKKPKNKPPERLSYSAKPKTKCLLINKFVNYIQQKKFKELAQREFDLMSIVLAADKALAMQNQLEIEYLI